MDFESFLKQRGWAKGISSEYFPEEDGMSRGCFFSDDKRVYIAMINQGNQVEIRIARDRGVKHSLQVHFSQLFSTIVKIISEYGKQNTKNIEGSFSRKRF